MELQAAKIAKKRRAEYMRNYRKKKREEEQKNAAPHQAVVIARLLLPNGQTLLSIVVNISPNQPIEKIIRFIHFVLLPFTTEGSVILGEDYHLGPMILSGDFNVNFNDPASTPLITFLKDKLELDMSSDKTVATTSGETTIDAVFQRFIDTLHSQVSVSYCSYHKPIISSIHDS